VAIGRDAGEQLKAEAKKDGTVFGELPAGCWSVLSLCVLVIGAGAAACSVFGECAGLALCVASLSPGRSGSAGGVPVNHAGPPGEWAGEDVEGLCCESGRWLTPALPCTRPSCRLGVSTHCWRPLNVRLVKNPAPRQHARPILYNPAGIFWPARPRRARTLRPAPANPSTFACFSPVHDFTPLPVPVTAYTAIFLLTANTLQFQVSCHVTTNDVAARGRGGRAAGRLQGRGVCAAVGRASEGGRV